MGKASHFLQENRESRKCISEASCVEGPPATGEALDPQPGLLSGLHLPTLSVQPRRSPSSHCQMRGWAR